MSWPAHVDRNHHGFGIDWSKVKSQPNDQDRVEIPHPIGELQASIFGHALLSGDRSVSERSHAQHGE